MSESVEVFYACRPGLSEVINVVTEIVGFFCCYNYSEFAYNGLKLHTQIGEKMLVELLLLERYFVWLITNVLNGLQPQMNPKNRRGLLSSTSFVRQRATK